MQRVLAPCLVDVEPFARAENVFVVVDGSPKAREAAERVREKLNSFRILFQEKNEGKGGAVAHGIERLLQNSAVQFVLARDHDNDHLANDSVNLVSLAARMKQDTGSDLVMSIGRRSSVHRHLGFVRGEFEWLMNEVVWEAAKFALARQNRTVNTQYSAAYDLVPDMQTGFKCYTRATAQLLVDALRAAPTIAPGLDLRRHGAEIPVIVETLVRGGVLGEITRMAWENQPLTTYDLAGRVAVKGTVLAWALQRTEVPTAVARQLLTNAIGRRIMSKEDHGMADLLRLANWTLDKLREFRKETIQPLDPPRLSEYF
jgi:hypothetical protein